MKKATSIIIIIILFLSACKNSADKLKLKSFTIKNTYLELEKVKEINLKENENYIIGLIYLFEINLREGIILISDPVFSDLKIFNINGEPLKIIGKKGEGPGEFRRIMGIAYDSQYIYMADDVLKRISKFYKDGEFVNSFPIPQNIDLDPGEIRLLDNNIYISSWQMQYKPIEETYKVKPIAVLDTSGNVLYHLGNYDEIYKKFKLLWTTPQFDIDEINKSLYLTNKLSWKVYKYDLGGDLIKVFGVKGKNFLEVREGIKGNESRKELQNIALNSSEVRKIRVSNYIYFQYSNCTEQFFETRSRLDKKHYLMVYTKEGEYIESDIKLPGGGILDVDDSGNIYIELSDEPGNRIIGVYKIKFVKK